jgi:hypothetical protein
MSNLPAVLYGDAEAMLATYLNAQLTEPVRLRVPKPRPASFVIVQRLGGTQEPSFVTEAATLTLEAWGRNDAEAHDLAQMARYWAHNLSGTRVGGVQVYRVQEFAGPARLPDPESDQSRYVLTLSISWRGAAL